MTAPRPLGYWVKTVDRLIDDRYASAASAAGVSRSGWQVLSRLALGASQAETAEENLAPFVGPDGSVSAVLDELGREGLVEQQGPEVRLTDAGHARVHEIQEAGLREVEERGTAGVAEAEREQLLATLQRIATNLGWLGES